MSSSSSENSPTASESLDPNSWLSDKMSSLTLSAKTLHKFILPPNQRDREQAHGRARAHLTGGCGLGVVSRVAILCLHGIQSF